MANKRRYKFLYDMNGMIKSHHGTEVWKLSEWQHVDGKVRLCSNGYHCSKNIREAFSYIQGDVLAIVEVKGDSDVSDDKECYQSMKIIKAYRWTKTDSVKLAIFAAEQVIDIYENSYPNDNRPRKAIEAAKKYLDDPTADAARAARAAADAARAARAADAAADAARAARAADAAARAARAADAAADAARAARAADAAARAAADAAADAARAAAYAAADAARAAARETMFKNIEAWFKDHIKELEEIK